MSGKVADKTRRSTRARAKLARALAKKLKDRTIIIYHEVIVYIINHHKPICRTGVILNGKR